MTHELATPARMIPAGRPDGAGRSTAPRELRLLVVTPTLGISSFLPETIASVLAAGIVGQHVVVAPAQALSGIAARWPHLTVVPESGPSCGMYAAINRGVAHAATWDWFTYLNDDDVLCAGFRDMAVACCAPDSGADIVYGEVRHVDRDGDNIGLMPVTRSCRHVLPLVRKGIMPFAQQGTLTSRSAWNRLGGFDEQFKLAADLDFFARAASQGLSMRRHSAEVARFRVHGAALSMQRVLARAELARIRRRTPARRDGTYDWWAKALFRMANLSRYLEQLRTTGTVRFEALLARESRRS